jgi:hypothetical protein
MTTVLLSGRSGAGNVIPRRARLHDRLTARVATARLDAQLAAGSCADASAALSLRAHELIGARCRARLARSLSEVLRRANQPWHPLCNPYAALPRARVLACREGLCALADELTAPRAVDAAGVASVQLLLCDGTGPLHAPSWTAEQLRDALCDARRALHPAGR